MQLKTANKNRRKIFFCITAIFVFINFSCNTVQKFDPAVYPPSERTVFIHNFTNDTFHADVNIEMTEALRRTIHRRKNFIVQKKRDTARIMIYGEIFVYRKEGRMYDNYGEPARFELMITCRIKARDQNRLIMDREFAASTDYSSTEGYIEKEYAARQRVYRKLTMQIASNLELAYISSR